MAKANAIRAGRAFVEIFADSKPLMRGLKAASAKLKAFGAQVAAIGRRMMMLGALIAAPLILAVRYFTKVGDALDKMSKRTGFSVKALSGLTFAARRSGTSLEAVEKAIKRMQRAIYDASRELAETVDAFGKLGITFADLEGKSPEEQFALIAKRLGAVEDATMRAALAQVIFGRAGTQILPMLKGYDALVKKARQLGLILTAKDIAAAHAFADAWGDLMDVLKINVLLVGSGLAPALVKMSKALVDGLKSLRGWVKANAGLIILVAKLAAYTIAAGAAIWLLGKAFVVLAGAIWIVSAALAVLNVLLHAAISPIWLIVAAIGGLIAITLKVSGIWDHFAKGMGAIFSEAWGAIMNALGAGDMEAAFAVITATASLLWTKFTTSLRIGWIEAMAGVKMIWEEILFFIRQGIAGLTQWWAEMWAKVGGIASDMLIDAKEAVGVLSQAQADEQRWESGKRTAGKLRAAGGIGRDIEAAHEERLRQINKESSKAIGAVQAELREKRKVLRAAIDAAKAAKLAGLPGTGGGGGGNIPDVGGELRRASTVGTFNPYAVRSLDPQGRIQQKILDAMLKSLDEEKKMNRLLAKKFLLGAVQG